jgi:transcriptional regulator with XRE-family HTH domain
MARPLLPRNHIDEIDGGPRATLASEFRLAMERKGWSISETARQASRFLSDGQRFGRAHVWHYIHGKALPRPHHLRALLSALELEPDSVLARFDIGAPLAADETARHRAAIRVRPAREPRLGVADAGDGKALLRIEAVVPWPIALVILNELKSVLGE